MKRLAFPLLFAALIATNPVLAQHVKTSVRVLGKPGSTGALAPKSLRSVVDASAGSLLATMKSRYAPAPVSDADRIHPTRPPALLGATPLKRTERGHANPLNVRLRRSDNGTINWVYGDLGQVDAASKGTVAAYTTEAKEALARLGSTLRLKDPAAELRLDRTVGDDIGYVHSRFRQYYSDVPVWASDVIVHFDRDGKLFAINGTYQPTPAEVDVVPSMGQDDAFAVVVQDLKSRKRWAPLSTEAARWLGIQDPEPRLVMYPDPELGMRLTWEVSVHAGLIDWYDYVVDATTGEILTSLAKYCSLDPGIPRGPAEQYDLRIETTGKATGSAQFMDASGVDLNGQNQTFRVHQADDGTFYLFSDLDNIGTFALPNLPESGGAITVTAGNSDLDENAQISFVTSNNNNWTDPATVSSHVNMKNTYEYYESTFGRNAINDKDQSIVSVVHVTSGGQGMDNAYWNGRVMAYGDGQQIFKPLAGAKDVAAHEMTHGVISETADLLYQAQSGALNESYADVFGVMNDREDFFLGEDVINDGHVALRDLKNPDNPQVRSGDAAVNGNFTQPAEMSQYRNLPNTQDGDNGGVHINSGIPNRAAALVIDAIGFDETEAIYYRALTMYLTRNSQFGDARSALIQAAKDLHGDNSPEVQAVAQAYDAVGVTEGGGDTSDPAGNDVPAVKGALSLIVFVVSDGSGLGIPDGAIAFIDPFSDSFVGVFSDPNAVARVGSQLATSIDGTAIWFVNGNGQLAVIDLSNANGSSVDGVASAPVITAPDFFLQQQGDLSNVAVGPIGFDQSGGIVEWLALVSAYDYDPTLYFSDLTQVIPVPLVPVTTQQGIGNNLIRYPDVVAWSKNPNIPRVAFDALNSVPLFSGLNEYWSIYEIDFVNEQIYNMIPAQPSDISVGNITYSSTNPDVVAFNVVTQDQFDSPVFDIALANFETGDLGTLDLPSIKDQQGNSILLDGERPVFAPDDAYLAFASVSLNSLVFYDLQSAGFSTIPFSQNIAPFGLSWFIFRGDVGDIVSTGTEEAPEIPSLARLYPNYPNPFSDRTTIRFDLNESSHVRLDVFDVLGRRSARLVDDRLAAGAHETTFEASGMNAGIYLVRMEIGDHVLTERMLLVQ